MTLMLLWEEYAARHPDQPTWRYSQFSENYRRYAQRLGHGCARSTAPARSFFIDFAGPTVALASGLRPYIELLRRCFAAYRPRQPARHDREPEPLRAARHDTVDDFARHYVTLVLPARPHHPHDEAKVESAGQVVERWILMRLRHQRFGNTDDVNEVIEPLLERLNHKPFQKLPGSRASAFADLDAPALQALPLQAWEWAVFKSVREHIDHHFEIHGHRYSVPQSLGWASCLKRASPPMRSSCCIAVSTPEYFSPIPPE